MADQSQPKQQQQEKQRQEQEHHQQQTLERTRDANNIPNESKKIWEMNLETLMNVQKYNALQLSELLQKASSEIKGRMAAIGNATEAILAASKSKGYVPNAYVAAFDRLDQLGLNHEGLFRLSGNMSEINVVLKKLLACDTGDTGDENESSTRSPLDKTHDIFSDVDKVHCVTGVIKKLLSDRLVVVPPAAVYIINRVAKYVGEEDQDKAIRTVTSLMAPEHSQTLAFIAKRLKKVADNSDKNRMHITALLTSVGPSLVPPERLACPKNDSEAKRKERIAREQRRLDRLNKLLIRMISVPSLIGLPLIEARDSDNKRQLRSRSRTRSVAEAVGGVVMRAVSRERPNGCRGSTAGPEKSKRGASTTRVAGSGSCNDLSSAGASVVPASFSTNNIAVTQGVLDPRGLRRTVPGVLRATKARAVVPGQDVTACDTKEGGPVRAIFDFSASAAEVDTVLSEIKPINNEEDYTDLPSPTKTSSVKRRNSLKMSIKNVLSKTLSSGNNNINNNDDNNTGGLIRTVSMVSIEKQSMAASNNTVEDSFEPVPDGKSKRKKRRISNIVFGNNKSKNEDTTVKNNTTPTVNVAKEIETTTTSVKRTHKDIAPSPDKEDSTEKRVCSTSPMHRCLSYDDVVRLRTSDVSNI